ncbi:MAG: hypothetical protein LBM97_00620, partial [Candidatus Nomurabacteria bacterium]|nr:hypothetical protein [Candidatus Nomurabacteria bacterium]
MKKLIISFILLLTCAGLLFIKPNNASAYLDGFEAGNIMSDFVMSNKDALSENGIQTFLKSKNSCDNTSISDAAKYPSVSYHIENGRFVCMADETFNGETAAHIIWQTAQDYGINPQVLLVLLEKEQGLVSDTWPNNKQYEEATGFGCPDTTTCDPSFSGLKNQLRSAGAFFREVLSGGWTNYPIGENYIKYNPDANCGGSIVNIQNRATSALYRYTPYQPNAGALAAGTGQAPCGAYGNRNFYNFFTKWFGSTHLLPGDCDSKVAGVVCVWSLIDYANNSEFLTTSKTDRDSLLQNSGYSYNGLAFYAFSEQVPNSIPVYQIKLANEHFYTQSESEKTYLSNSGNSYEKIAFYVYPSSNTANAAYPIYRLNGNNGHFLTASPAEKDKL